MDEIKCPKCGVNKNVNLFAKNKSRSNGYNSYCKECLKEDIKNSQRTKKGVVISIYGSQKRSSISRGTKLPLYTFEELYSYCINSILFNKLYENWKHSNYESGLKPSFDRINYDNPYGFDNIRLMTWEENAKRQYGLDRNRGGSNMRKRIAIISEDGNIIKEFDSINKGKIYANLSNSTDITSSIKRKGTAGGYRWKII